MIVVIHICLCCYLVFQINKKIQCVMYIIITSHTGQHGYAVCITVMKLAALTNFSEGIFTFYLKIKKNLCPKPLEAPMMSFIGIYKVYSQQAQQHPRAIAAGFITLKLKGCGGEQLLTLYYIHRA